MKKNANRSILRMALTGFFIGVAAIAPGISAGAITIVFGLYEPITDAVAHIWRDFRKKLLFLAPLSVGAVAGMLVFGRLITHLFVAYPDLTCALFVGLIVGTLPSVFHTAARDGFRLRYLLATAALAILTVWLTALEQLQYTGAANELPHWLTLVCGGILGLGSVLPGVSASFVLMAMGVYESVLQVLSTPDIPRMLLLGIGFGGVVILFSRLVSWLFKKAHGWMSFAVAGMLVGSIFHVIPTPTANGQGVLVIALMIGGAALSYYLLKRNK